MIRVYYIHIRFFTPYPLTPPLPPLPPPQAKEKHWSKKLQGLKLHRIGVGAEDKEAEAETEV